MTTQNESNIPPAHFGIPWPDRVRNGNMLVPPPLPWSQLHDIDTLYPYLDRAIIGAFNDPSKMTREDFINYYTFVFRAFTGRHGETQKLIGWLRQMFGTIARLIASSLQKAENPEQFKRKFLEFHSRWESAADKLTHLFKYLNRFLSEPPKSSRCRSGVAYLIQTIWDKEIKAPYWERFLDAAGV